MRSERGIRVLSCSFLASWFLIDYPKAAARFLVAASPHWHLASAFYHPPELHSPVVPVPEPEPVPERDTGLETHRVIRNQRPAHAWAGGVSDGSASRRGHGRETNEMLNHQKTRHRQDRQRLHESS